VAARGTGVHSEPFASDAIFVEQEMGFPFGYFLRITKAIAPSLGIEIVPVPITNVDDLIRSIESFARVSNGGLLAPPDNTVEEHRDVVIALAARHRLPAVYATRDFVVAGGLMSYSTDVLKHFRQAASYVDRVLRGANPANLPVETPTKYETVLNLKTAKALGFEVSPTLLVRADEVIE
jgi:putative ABC transport system substrate-binding protein